MLVKTSHSGLASKGMSSKPFKKSDFLFFATDDAAEDLGAAPVLRLGLGDDQADFGLDQELDPWAAELWAALAGKGLAAASPTPLPPDEVFQPAFFSTPVFF